MDLNHTSAGEGAGAAGASRMVTSCHFRVRKEVARHSPSAASARPPKAKGETHTNTLDFEHAALSGMS